MLTTVSRSFAPGELQVPLVHPVLFPHSNVSDLEPFDTRVRRSDGQVMNLFIYYIFGGQLRLQPLVTLLDCVHHDA
jgi:hypothetical protein